MDLTLSEDCPIFHDENFGDLFLLLRKVADGWHSLLSPDPRRLKTLSPASYQIFGEYLEQAYKGGAKGLYSTVGPRDCSSCDPKKLALFSSLPTVLLVENGTVDGNFVTEVVKSLKPNLMKNFIGRLASVSILHAGGIGQVPAEVTRTSKVYVDNHVEGLPSRFVVLVDSDAKYPGMLSGQARRARSAANDRGLASHVLEKRAIENYVPDDSLFDHAGIDENLVGAVEAIVKLPALARDHFPMKEGIKDLMGLVPEERALYPEGLGELPGMSNFMSKFFEGRPRGFAAKSLRARDHSNDLGRMLATLEENL